MTLGRYKPVENGKWDLENGRWIRAGLHLATSLRGGFDPLNFVLLNHLSQHAKVGEAACSVFQEKHGLNRKKKFWHAVSLRLLKLCFAQSDALDE